jgi:hypothetical protein
MIIFILVCIFMFISTMEEHGHHWQDMCEHLGAHMLKLNLGKFRFLQSQVEYSGPHDLP